MGEVSDNAKPSIYFGNDGVQTRYWDKLQAFDCWVLILPSLTLVNWCNVAKTKKLQWSQ